MLPSPCIELGQDERARLLAIARRSLEQGLETGRAAAVDIDGVSQELAIPAAVFVTLTRDGELRGCVGSLQAAAPLAQAVADAAFNAAFRDRRFPALGADEVDAVRIEISVLSAMEPLEVSTREQLLQTLRPGVDGLLLEDRGYRSTFLPKVWEKITSPAEFLEHLYLKAGLGARHWSDTIRFHRYQALSFAEN